MAVAGVAPSITAPVNVSRRNHVRIAGGVFGPRRWSNDNDASCLLEQGYRDGAVAAQPTVTRFQRRSVALMVDGLGPCRGTFGGPSARGNGHAPAGVLGLTAIRFARLDQRN
jgi:hypothetical protein